jgi:hypothetical protein
MALLNNFMERFWQLVDEKASIGGENTNLKIYIFTHIDGHIFVQAYNDYHLFQQLHNNKKLMADEDLFEIIQDFFENFETEKMCKIVDYMLLNCGFWSDFNYKQINFMTDYSRF